MNLLIMILCSLAPQRHWQNLSWWKSSIWLCLVVVFALAVPVSLTLSCALSVSIIASLLLRSWAMQLTRHQLVNSPKDKRVEPGTLGGTLAPRVAKKPDHWGPASTAEMALAASRQYWKPRSARKFPMSAPLSTYFPPVFSRSTFPYYQAHGISVSTCSSRRHGTSASGDDNFSRSLAGGIVSKGSCHMQSNLFADFGAPRFAL